MPNGSFGRRAFLKQTTASAAAAALWSQTAEAKAKVRLDADVIVIGAGMAGISAAAHLHPHRRVIVLEGRRERIGGRIWTSYAWPDEPVDLGASWLTHEQVNPLRRIVDAAGIRLITSQLTNLALFEDGTRLPDSVVSHLEDTFAGIVVQMKLIGAQRLALGQPDIPASQAFDAVVSKMSFDSVTRRRINYFASHVFQEAQAAPLSALSTFELGEDGVTLQGLTTASIIPEGYAQLVHLFAQGLDIRLGHVVDTIAYGKNGVAVTLEDGRTLRAKYAVVTLPLGVLKAGSVTFIPDLPRWKRRSIDRLGFGSTEKTYLRFPRAFWPIDKDGVDRVAETPEGRWSAWFNFHKYTVGPNGEPGKPTLLSFNHAPYGTQLEHMSDAQVLDAAYTALRNQYKDKALRPIAIQRSHWATDRFARGVIPNKPPGATDADFRALGAPVANRLFFAGDSTTDLFFGFVLGAYQTGIREATRILHMHK